MFVFARIALLLIGVALLVVPWRDAKADVLLYAGGGVLVILLAVLARPGGRR